MPTILAETPTTRPEPTRVTHPTDHTHLTRVLHGAGVSFTNLGDNRGFVVHLTLTDTEVAHWLAQEGTQR